MSKVFRSRLYGKMNAKRRRALGLAGHRREEIWRLMAREETAIGKALWWRSLSWWRRLLVRLRRAAVRLCVGLRRAVRRQDPEWRPRAPHAPTDAAVRGR